MALFLDCNFRHCKCRHALSSSSLADMANWQNPTPSQVVEVTYENYVITNGYPVQIKANEYIQFDATSTDVTYGFGVFRKDNSMVFQMQVLPGRTNTIIWKFDETGMYDVRSTEYSGPKHSDMVVRDALEVK